MSTKLSANALFVCLVFVAFTTTKVTAQTRPTQQVPSGVVLRTEKASPGYTLIAPFGGQQTFLIDLDGKVVHSWESTRKPSQAAYLLDDGGLLRTVKIPNATFNVKGGPAGGIQKFNWDGELIWEYFISNEHMLSHHDVEPLPNGNVLVVAWEVKTRDEAIAAGRDPEKTAVNGVWPEVVLEVQPTGKKDGKIVWEWHLWDHLVQSFDASKKNFGQPAEHRELIDLNFVERPVADWIHMNSIDYNAELDQILLCGRTFDEIWVIDHSTTTDQASGHAGGHSNRGGDYCTGGAIRSLTLPAVLWIRCCLGSTIRTGFLMGFRVRATS